MTIQPQDLVSQANIYQGADSIYNLSTGNIYPVIARPHGMNFFSPQTAESKWFFHSAEVRLQGMRLTHQPSPWLGDYGHFCFLPVVGTVYPQAETRSSSYDKKNHIARPDYYKVRLLRYNTTFELTPTDRGAMMRIDYPSASFTPSLKNPAAFMLSLFEGDGWIKILPEKKQIIGKTSARRPGAGVPENFAHFFVFQFDRDFTSWGISADKKDLHENIAELAGDALTAAVRFDTSSNRHVEVRIATSFISIDQALVTFEAELGGKSFDTLQQQSHQIWQDHLARIQIETDNTNPREKDQAVTFYSALYRSLLFPRMFHEIDAAGKTRHFSPYDGQIHDGVLYTDNGFWDIHRSLFPLLLLVYPEKFSSMLNGFLNSYKEGGNADPKAPGSGQWLPKWCSPGHFACMVGTHADVTFADAIVNGITGFDYELAYEAIRKNATVKPDDSGLVGRLGVEYLDTLGYVPCDRVEYAVARTLDFAYSDFAIGKAAEKLGKKEDAQLFAKRAKNYRNIYDNVTGFMRAKNHAGEWLGDAATFQPIVWGNPYVEAAAWQYLWDVPHDAAGLAELMGGKDAYLAKLNEFFTAEPLFHIGAYPQEIHEMTEMAYVDFGQYAHSNEPVHHVAYMFSLGGDVSKTQYWTRRVMDELYTPTTYCGDEDNGQMASWYVFSALGFYPATLATGQYVLGSPLFRKAQIHLPNGKTLTIDAPNNSHDNVYVKKVEYNNRPQDPIHLSYKTLMEGGTLTFHMSNTPT